MFNQSLSEWYNLQTGIQQRQTDKQTLRYTHVCAAVYVRTYICMKIDRLMCVRVYVKLYTESLNVCECVRVYKAV